MTQEGIRVQVEKLPQKTGVYIFKGETLPLYIGKAEDIRSRVRSHFQAAKRSRREKRIIESTRKIDYIVTESETEALIEENILIKTYKPRYNVRLSDDKTYPYIKIDLKSDYPRLSIVRRMGKGKAKYFGPYADVGAMRNSLKIIRKIFPVRTCRKDLKKYKMRPCLYHHLGQCIAPCADLTSKQEYDRVVNRLILFLEGKRGKIIEDLRSEMREASLKQEYEKAAILRDKIYDLEKTVREVKVVLTRRQNLDAIALLRWEGEVCVQVLQVREGKIISSENFNLKSAEDAGDQEALESFIKQYYGRRTYIPERLIVNRRINDAKIIAGWLSAKCGRKVEVKRPAKNMKDLIDIALENAKTHLEQLRLEKTRAMGSLLQLKRDLSLDHIPRLIECFDVSNLGEKESVGSKVAFLEGTSFKKGYRMYRIKTISKQDDPAMIGEVVQRRFTRLQEEEGYPPDLVVVDGGTSQVRAAKRKLDELGLEIPVIGLAKGKEQVHLSNGRILNINRRSRSSLLLQHLRDEAHRFALKYHRKRREKRMPS